MMKKAVSSAAELQALALSEIQRNYGCESVKGVSVKLIRDDRADCNWSIAVSDLGEADAFLARRTALIVQERLCQQFDLIEQIRERLSDERSDLTDRKVDAGSKR